MSVREKDDPELYAKIQEQNLLRQYDLLSNCIEIGLKKGIEFFDKYTLWALNYAAVSNISQFGGRYREEPIYVGNHFPPHFRDVPNQMDRFFSVVHENWAILDHPTVLPAYALWRLNWIHPFVEGNGRTARGACYYLICLKQGRLLPGRRRGLLSLPQGGGDPPGTPRDWPNGCSIGGQQVPLVAGQPR